MGNLRPSRLSIDLAGATRRVIPGPWVSCWFCSVGWHRRGFPILWPRAHDVTCKTTALYLVLKPRRLRPGMTCLPGTCCAAPVQGLSLPSMVRCVHSQGILLEHICLFQLSVPIVTVWKCNLNSSKPLSQFLFLYLDFFIIRCHGKILLINPFKLRELGQLLTF